MQSERQAKPSKLPEQSDRNKRKERKQKGNETKTIKGSGTTRQTMAATALKR